jgi:hypothetical protein
MQFRGIYRYIYTKSQEYIYLINNYSPKARWLFMNKNWNEVEVFICDNHQTWGE